MRIALSLVVIMMTSQSFSAVHGNEIGRSLLDSEVRYVTYGDVLYRESLDGTTRMTQPDPDSPLVEIEVSPGEPNSLYGITSNGRLFRANDGNDDWMFVSALPDFGKSNSRERLAVSIVEPGVAYYGGIHSVYVSRDFGAHWTLISDLPGEIDRLVYNSEFQLTVTTVEGWLLTGEADAESANWHHTRQLLPLQNNEKVYVFPGSKFLVAASGNETSSRWLSSRGEWISENSKTSSLGAASVQRSEFSTRNVTNNCRYFFYNSRTRKYDNYWDVSWEGHPGVDGEMHQVRIVKGQPPIFETRPNPNCHWNARFCPTRVKIYAWRGSSLVESTTGTVNARIQVRILPNYRNLPVIRSFGVNFIGDRNPNNAWVAIVQGARLTNSCQVQPRTQRIIENVGPAHLTVSFTVTGSNASCPSNSVQTIVCGGEVARTQTSSVNTVFPGALLSVGRAGVGECALTQSSPRCDD